MKVRGQVAAALTAATMVVAAPQVAVAQFPPVPPLPSLELPPPPPLPAPSSLPPLPPPPPVLPTPELEGLDLPPQLSGRGAVPRQIGGFDFDPPAPIENMMTPSGETYTVQSDSTKLLGDVKMSYVQVDTMQGSKPAIRIDCNRVELDNLRVRFPGASAGVEDIWQRSGPGVITTLNGNFHILVARMTITSQIAGVTLPIPITVDASWAPEQIRAELSKAGAGLPDDMSNLMVVVDGTMETYYISADDLRAEQGLSIKP